MNNETLKEYVKKFGDFPPLIMGFLYDNEKYIELMKSAIAKGEEITEDTITNYIDDSGIQLGVVNKEDVDMKEDKIRKLLKTYGAVDEEIENFMEDLASMKEDIEQINEYQDDEKSGGKDYKEFAKTNNDDADDEMFEEMAEDEEKHDDYLLNAETLKVLKATKEGRDLIIKAPEMAKEELKKAIADYLQKNK